MYNEYQTKDLGEAAALLTSGIAMLDLVWRDSKAYFVFEDPMECRRLAQEYFFGSLQLPVRFYYENVRTIKRKLYEEQPTERGGSYV